MFVPIKVYAAKYGVDPSAIRKRCIAGDYKTAKKEGRDWFIDEHEPYIDRRRKKKEDDVQDLTQAQKDLLYAFKSKKRMVEQGRSRIFKSWNEHEGILKEDFIDGLRWLSEDPLLDDRLLTRELGCKKGKLYRLKRVYSRLGDFVGFYTEDNKLWYGTVSISIRDGLL
jgi:hypothetical protein